MQTGKALERTLQCGPMKAVDLYRRSYQRSKTACVVRECSEL